MGGGGSFDYVGVCVSSSFLFFIGRMEKKKLCSLDLFDFMLHLLFP